MGQVKRAAQNGEFGIRRNDIDRIRLDALCVDRFAHRHRRGALQKLRQECLVRGIHVLDHDVGETAAGRNAGQELLERLEAASGRAQPDDAQSNGSRRPRGGETRRVFHTQVCLRAIDRAMS